MDDIARLLENQEPERVGTEVSDLWEKVTISSQPVDHRGHKMSNTQVGHSIE